MATVHRPHPAFPVLPASILLPARLRFVLAAVTLGLLSLDGFSRPGMTTSQVVSEALAGVAGLVLFAQALLDQQTERAVEVLPCRHRVSGFVLPASGWF